ncbi:hypothetical protein OR214_03302 [Ralstonia pickettii OR214]|uniref:Uncharacterized protein n=1 Tax=Ralstonia pickettii OR214 TaxID=1264675 RepID=R0E354_RALPI|nr:hypothetical protein OR214_03302 [Ralstonia pickettii OR214]
MTVEGPRSDQKGPSSAVFLARARLFDAGAQCATAFHRLGLETFGKSQPSSPYPRMRASRAITAMGR